MQDGRTQWLECIHEIWEKYFLLRQKFIFDDLLAYWNVYQKCDQLRTLLQNCAVRTERPPTAAKYSSDLSESLNVIMQYAAIAQTTEMLMNCVYAQCFLHVAGLQENVGNNRRGSPWDINVLLVAQGQIFGKLWGFKVIWFAWNLWIWNYWTEYEY